ncbi:M24 family metallopeptidase [Paraburkholderia azotifigens]|uniref:Aminopeptidase P family protein n=1 Tax=Paraburkholderia azotifigens TaxID=2057004 RepID=A0A5C6V496_9BURK|nr:M24 family metallopeptidase [Paraburkholderia azotifigens]TXC80152.1 aminopeptidase P family protein [Paraburkholderia azotifigens]
MSTINGITDLHFRRAESTLGYRTDDAVLGYRAGAIDGSLVRAFEDLDRKSMRAFRLTRLREQLRVHDYAGMLLCDPLNIRYATDTNNLGLWVMHSPSRYVFVATDGPVILFDFTSSRHNSEGIETIDEIRPATPWIYFLAGPRVEEKAELWAQEIADIVRTYGSGNRRLAVDRCDPWGAERLKRNGIELFDAQPLTEQARVIKGPQEIEQHRISMGVCDLGIARMREALTPGITENQLWSVFHATNIAHGGEYAESRLLTSGERTNPWFQDTSNRVIQAGDMVAFDTDMVGPGGSLSDISRSFVCPGRAVTGHQRDLFGFAADQIAHNVSLLKAGLSFREFAERCWPVPDRYVHNRYMMMLHGVGLVDEYPSVAYAVDFDAWGYDGVFQENMVVSVESYIGEQGGKEGVKLEEQVLITSTGAIVLSGCPLLSDMNA